MTGQRSGIQQRLQQDTVLGKLSRRFACKTDTSVGHYRWFNKICSVASYSSEIRSNLGACCRTDERLYSVSTGKTSQVVAPHMMDKLVIHLALSEKSMCEHTDEEKT